MPGWLLSHPLARRVFVASDRFLLDTPIWTVAAAMVLTLEHAHLSIYNWVQVLYYVLLQKGHLDMYVGNREAAPAHADHCLALPLINYL